MKQALRHVLNPLHIYCRIVECFRIKNNRKAKKNVLSLVNIYYGRVYSLVL